MVAIGEPSSRESSQQRGSPFLVSRISFAATDLEKSVEEGDVVGPFVQCRLEEGQRLVNHGCVLSKGLVF